MAQTGSYFRPMLRWMVVLVVLCACGGGGYGYYLLGRSDEMLKQTLLNKIAELAPGWDVELGRTRFDFFGHIRIADMKLRVGDERQLLLDVPEVVLVVDRERIVEKQAVIQQVRIVKPQILLERDLAGKWNVQGLPPRPRTNSTVAEWIIEQATLTVRLAQADGEQTEIILRNVAGTLIPSGRRRFLISGQGQLDLVDSVTVDATWDLDANMWDGVATLKELKVGTPLMELLAGAIPTVRTKLNDLDALTARLLEERHASLPGTAVAPPTLQPGSISQTAAKVEATPIRHGLGLNAAVDLELRLAKDGEGQITGIAKTKIQKGEWSHPLLPFPLYELRGEFESDLKSLTIRTLSGRNAGTAFGVHGQIAPEQGGPVGSLTVGITDLVAEPRVRGCLTGGLARVYDSVSPKGHCDISLKLANKTDGKWGLVGGVTTFKDCTMTHSAFPYMAEQINGTMAIREHELLFDVTGLASGFRPLKLKGKVINPGPECSAVFNIEGKALRIDERLRAACSQKLQGVFDSLRVQGIFDGHLRLMRPPGLNQRYTPYLVARVRNATLFPKCFPYAVSDATCRLTGAGSYWKIEEFQGRHDVAVITAHGEVKPDEQLRSTVDLNVEMQGALIDQQLYAALDEKSQTTWKEFSPAGQINSHAHVQWTETQPADIDLTVNLVDASLQMKSFPYLMENVQSRLKLKHKKLTIESFQARHHDTQMELTGTGDFSQPDEWLVTLKNIVIDDLNPDRPFRKTLPGQLRDTFETLDPRGKVSVRGMMEFRGTNVRGSPVGAAWDLEFIHSGSTVTAGIDIQDLYGTAGLRGTWDGEKVLADGQLSFDSMVYNGYQLTKIRGPFSINGKQVVIGSKEALNQNNSPDGRAPVDNIGRLTADFIGGVISLDGNVKLEKQTSYHVKITLAGGRLEQFAALYLPGQNKLRGIMNGLIDLYGKGNSPRNLQGTGRLTISPAALYELPVIVAIFKILNFGPPDKTAFRTAGFSFNIENSKCMFRRIELIGDTISLIGRGMVGFDGALALDFYSRSGRAQIPIPILREVLAETFKGFVRVTVRGTTTNPSALVQTMPQMDDALRTFLGALAGPGQNRNAQQQQPTRAASRP